MTTKRIVSLLGFLALSGWLFACGDDVIPTPATPTPAVTATPTITPTPTATPTETPDTLDGIVTLLAGGTGGCGNSDGTGPDARFSLPDSVATDGTNIFVADTNNSTIRQIIISTGEVTTLAGTAGTSGFANGTGAAARFFDPVGVATDGTNVFVADMGNHRIRKIVIATAEVTTLAGSSSPGSADGTGAAASFWYPRGVATEGTNVFVADTNNHTVRKITIDTAEVTTLAGTAGSSGSADDTGVDARFNSPRGVTVTVDGTSVFVADTVNHTVRKITIATAEVTTLAGTAGSPGSADGTGSAATFENPYSLTTDDGTNVFVADTANNTIRKIVTATAEVTTVAGTAGSSGSTDGTGIAARFDVPSGITLDGTTTYVADRSNCTVRKVMVTSGVVTTPIGSAVSSGSSDGLGETARFSSPRGMAIVESHLFVTDYDNHTIRKILIETGEVTTFVGLAGANGSADGIGNAARFKNPEGLATDGTFLFVADTGNHTIRKVTLETAEVVTLAGSAGSFGANDGVGAAAQFWFPADVEVFGVDLFVSGTMNHTIRKIDIATATVTTFAGTAGAMGYVDDTGSDARFLYPRELTTDGNHIFVTSSSAYTIRKIDPATATVTTFAGTIGINGSDDGIGTSAKFFAPVGLASDGTDLFLCDEGNNTIRRINIETQQVTTLAGAVGQSSTREGTGTEARFNKPFGMATSTGTVLFVSNEDEHNIVKID